MFILLRLGSSSNLHKTEDGARSRTEINRRRRENPSFDGSGAVGFSLSPGYLRDRGSEEKEEKIQLSL